MNNMYKILESFNSLTPETKVVEAKTTDPELQKIAHNYPREVKLLIQTGDFDKDLYSALFDYYNGLGEMPYGVAKARDGDPYEWIFQRFTNDMGLDSPLSNVGQDAGLGLDKAIQGVEEEMGTYGAMAGQGMGYGSITEGSADFYRELRDLVEGKKSKPDFLDVDKDGNKKEPFKKAVKDKQVDESLTSVELDEGVNRFTPKDIKSAINYKNAAGPIWKVTPSGSVRITAMNADVTALNKILSRPLASQEDWDMLKKQMRVEILKKNAGSAIAEAKPDFLDVDKDGNKKEPFKKAIKDKKVNEMDYGGGRSPHGGHNLPRDAEDQPGPQVTVNPQKAKDAKKDIEDQLTKAFQNQPVKQNVGGKKVSEAAAENPYQQRILDANKADLEEFLKTGYLDTTSDLYYQMYEYYANQMDPKVRRNQDAQYDFITGKIREIAGVNEARGDDWDFSDLPPEPTTRKIAGKRYGGSAQVDEPEDDEDDSKPGVKAAKKRGRPAGTKRAIGAKGPTGKSKLLKKGAIKEGDDEGVDMVKLAKVIASCTSPEQLEVAKKMAKNFLGKHRASGDDFRVSAFKNDMDRERSVKRDLGAKAKSLSAEPVAEKAPPGAKAERMVKGIKKSLSKDGHLSDKDKAIAYATTWKAHKQGKVEEEAGVEEESTGDESKESRQAAKSIYHMLYDANAADWKDLGYTPVDVRNLTKVAEMFKVGKPKAARQLAFKAGISDLVDEILKGNWVGAELEEESTGDYSAKKARAGKDIGKPGKNFEKIAKSAGKKYGSKERGEKVAGAVLAKLRGKNESKDEEQVEETTCAGSVAPSVAAPKKASAGGYQFGKGVYESINSQVEKMIVEGMSINVNVDSNGQKSINVSATDEDADKLAEILKMAGIAGGGVPAVQEAQCCEACGTNPCECSMVEESNELANGPDEEYADTDMLTNKLAGGLNKPKTTVAGNGQTTVPVTAVQVKESQEVAKIENSLWNLFKAFKK